jgi:hypothetical protein
LEPVPGRLQIDTGTGIDRYGDGREIPLMKASRRVGIYGKLDVTRLDQHDTFLAHDEQMRRFRQVHGEAAGLKIAVMMRLPLYIMPAITDYGGTATSDSVIRLPGLLPMRRWPLSLFCAN